MNKVKKENDQRALTTEDDFSHMMNGEEGSRYYCAGVGSESGVHLEMNSDGYLEGVDGIELNKSLLKEGRR